MNDGLKYGRKFMTAYNHIYPSMFIVILLSPLLFLACYLLPLLATFLSSQHSDKWIAFWLLQIAASWTLIPFVGLFFECEVQMLVKIIFALALYVLLNQEKVSQLHSGLESVVVIVDKQKQNVNEKVSGMAKQYGLTQ